MKQLTLLIAATLMTCTALGQVQQTRYQIIDEFQKEIIPLFSTESRSIRFNLIRLTDLENDHSLYGVETLVQTKKYEHTGSSLRFANLRRYWNVLPGSVELFYKKINESGYILLQKENLNNIEDFINESLVATGKAQDRYTQYKLTLNNKLEVGFYHDPDDLTQKDLPKHQQWKFYVTIDDATYTTNYKRGLELMRQLSRYRERIEEIERQAA
ncbi:MAG TPA: hypothetical protein VJ876_07850 [Bacteroidales bacterium]|nr:hypothetical protein [Bacteroidales bacterium]